MLTRRILDVTKKVVNASFIIRRRTRMTVVVVSSSSMQRVSNARTAGTTRGSVSRVSTSARSTSSSLIASTATIAIASTRNNSVLLLRDETVGGSSSSTGRGRSSLMYCKMNYINSSNQSRGIIRIAKKVGGDHDSPVVPPHPLLESAAVSNRPLAEFLFAFNRIDDASRSELLMLWSRLREVYTRTAIDDKIDLALTRHWEELAAKTEEMHRNLLPCDIVDILEVLEAGMTRGKIENRSYTSHSNSSCSEGGGGATRQGQGHQLQPLKNIGPNAMVEGKMKSKREDVSSSSPFPEDKIEELKVEDGEQALLGHQQGARNSPTDSTSASSRTSSAASSSPNQQHVHVGNNINMNDHDTSPHKSFGKSAAQRRFPELIETLHAQTKRLHCNFRLHEMRRLLGVYKRLQLRSKTNLALFTKRFNLLLRDRDTFKNDIRGQDLRLFIGIFLSKLQKINHDPP